MIEKLEQIVEKQVEAIQNLKIDKITVWDAGGGAGGQGASTAKFLSSLVGSLPPLQEVAKMAGVELPEYLGRMKGPGPSDPHGGASEATPSRT
jgi:flotillin